MTDARKQSDRPSGNHGGGTSGNGQHSHDDAGTGRENGSTFSLILRLVRLGLKHKLRLAAALAVTVAMQIMAVGELVSAGLAVDILRKGVDPNAPAPPWPLGIEPPAEAPFMTLLLIAAAAALVFSILRALGYLAGRMADELLAQAIVVDLRDQLYRKLQQLSFSFYDTHDSGTIINRVTTDVQSVRTFIQGVLIRAFTAIATLAVFLSAMLSIHVGLTLACITFVFLQGIVMLRFIRRARPAFREQRALLDGLISRLSEAVQGIRVIRAFGRERRQMEAYEHQSAVARDQRGTIWRMVGNHLPIVEGSAWIAVAILIGYGGYLVQIGPAAGGIALGSVWVFFGLLRTLAGQLEPIVRVAGQMPEALTAAERVFGILDTDPRIASPSAPRAGADHVVRGEIEFRNVSFAYNDGTKVLHDVSLTIRPGETLAIVGPTGSGKSTLLGLVPRFHDVSGGQVLLDGIDVREWDLATLRRAIGFVFQEPYLFSNTIRANISFGAPDAEMERVERAARSAAAAPFIERLEYGYDTIVGERGLMLSGGERQRLSIARAIIVDPPILFFDDAMSAVDAGTESYIQSQLDRLASTRTTVVIAHRLSTLRRADRVIVLDRGRIAAQGTHDELMRTDSHYRDAALVQMEEDQQTMEDVSATE